MNRIDGYCVPLTPPGAAAIAVVRIGGTGLGGGGAGAFLKRHFSKAVSPGRCVHGELTDGDVVLDDPLVVLAADGAFVDISLHGGPWVVKSVIDLAEREGFYRPATGSTPAPAQPFRAAGDAFDSSGEPLPDVPLESKTPLEREVEAWLPLAQTEEAVRMLLAQPAAWERLKASFDPSEAAKILADRSLDWHLQPPRVAIVGPANVGKSTLANALFAQERSITADLPGTTRDWVGEIANIDGLAAMLLDTPGIRDTTDEIERRAIEASGGEIARSDLVVLVLDATMPWAEQQELAEKYPDALRVINKSDVAAIWDLASVEAKNGNGWAIRTIATTGAGVDQLRSAIRRRFGSERERVDLPRCWTERQQTILRRAMEDPTMITLM